MRINPVETYRNAMLLVFGDSMEENTAIQTLLNGEGFNVLATDNEEEAISLFERKRPVLIIMTLFDVVEAEKFYRTLQRCCHDFDKFPHRSLLLCRGNQAQSAFDLCLDGTMNDYVVSRPMIDPFRLRLSVYQALKNCSASEEIRELQYKIGGRDGDLNELENTVNRAFAKFASVNGDVLSVFVEFTKKLSNDFDAFRDRFLVETEGEQPLKNQPDEIIRLRFQQFKDQSLAANLQSISEQLDVPADWLGEFEKEIKKYLTLLLGGRLDAQAHAPAVIPSVPQLLLVDDDPTYRTMLKRMLESNGYGLIEAEDGIQAIEELACVRPNLIFLDLMMPNLDGMETLKRIKVNSALKDVPVIMLTGLTDTDMVRECIRAGAIDYIVKPSNRATILHKVETHIR